MVVLTNVAGLLVFAGFCSILYNLITKQVSVKRRPAYWLSLVLSAGLVGIYVDFVVELIRGVLIFPRWTIRAAFVVVYIILGCLLILIPWIDRQEFRELSQAADRLGAKMDDSGNGNEGD